MRVSRSIALAKTEYMYLMVHRMLPLSGRHGAWGGEAESSWRPVDSTSLLNGH